MSGLRNDGGGLSAEIRQLSFRHGMTESRVRELLDAAANGDSGSHCLSRLKRSLDLGGAAAWQHRVDNALGAEALFDQDFRFRAVSRAGRTVTSTQGQQIEFPRSVFIGARHFSLLPAKASYLGDGKNGFEGLRDLGFFDGRILGVQIEMELNFGFHFLDCVMEVWAIRTVDKGIMAHSLQHPTGKTKPSIDSPGVLVRSVRYF